MSRLLALLLATLVVAAPANAAQKKALFDNAHAETAGNADWEICTTQPIPSPDQSLITPTTPNTYWVGAISSYGVEMVKRGFYVATNTGTITYTAGGSSNPYDLSNWDVFIVPEPNTLFSAAEKTAILNFVHDGGGLVAISDHSGSDRNNDGYDSPMIWNDLDASHAYFGVHFGVSGDANNDVYTSATVSTNVATSPTDSVTQVGVAGVVAGVQYAAGTTMTIYTSSNPTVRGEVWMNGVAQTSTSQIMAASCQYGSGRVFFIGDSSPVDDGSAAPGNSSIYDGWDVSGDSTIFLNGAVWAARRATNSDTQAPTVSITSPNGGEDWKASSSHAITWTASDNVGVTSVDLAYSTNGGTSFANTIATGLANTGTYTWTVPNTTSTNARVRVIAHDAAGNLGSDSSATNFTISKWTIAASAGANGSISPNGSVLVAQGASQAFTISPNANYHVADVQVDGGSAGAVTSYTFTGVAASHTIAASFAIDTRTITASAGAGGSIAPSGAVTVNYGDTPTFTITPNATYAIADVQVDGVSVGAVPSYQFGSVTANHTIAASFASTNVPLTVDIVGGGSVDRNPNLPTYPLYSSVVLTGVPGTGWAFVGWSGDTTAAANPITLAITGARVVTATFADTAAPVVVVTAPVGGENWVAGSSQNITWTATDNGVIGTVALDYSVSGPDGPWLAIASGLANTGSYGWTVPASPASPANGTALVRVTVLDGASNAGVAASDSAFTIVDPTAGVETGAAVLALARPAPNPSTGAALLAFSLPKAGHATLDVLDAAGRRVAQFGGEFGPGQHGLRWNGQRLDGSRARAGLYFVRLTTPFGNRLQRLVRLD